MTALWASKGTSAKPQAFSITLEWLRYFLAEDPQLDWTTITCDRYERFWDQSVEQYGAVIGTDNPDLTDFRDRGGKAIVWHGWADQLISAQGTVDYYSRVQKQMGGPEKTLQFIRLFMAPGVGHCAGGTRTRPLCPYPLVAKYKGTGSTDDAANFMCSTGF